MADRGFVSDLRIVLRGADFRKLFSVRLSSQFGDGILNVGLASFVFFSPERAADAPAAAGIFAALLLPYSLIGPFAGVLLDRWRRRNVLFVATLLRAAIVLVVAALVTRDVSGPGFYLTVLAAIGVNRFFLSGLGASLPHVVPQHELVMANAVSPTCGTVAALLGAGAGYVMAAQGVSDAWLFIATAMCYLVSATLCLRMRPDLLGPDITADAAALVLAAKGVYGGFRQGIRHVWHRPAAAEALGVIAAHRFAYGVSTVSMILLFRNYFNNPDDVDAGLAGLGATIAASGAGFALAAVLTPIATRRMRPQTWMVALLVSAGVAVVMPGMLFTETAVVVASFGLGICAQGVKICVDALVQAAVDDEFRGRVFSLYDMIFNLVFVLAAIFAAMTLPATGKSYVVAAICAGIYWLTALLFARASRDVTVDLG